MKVSKFLLLFLSIISFWGCEKSVTKIKRQYFTDDVKNVELLAVNYCVDNNGQISSVVINPEKTNYKNQEKINLAIENLKKIYYSEDSKLRNNCYDYIFVFANTKYENKKLDASKISKCDNLRTGTFKYSDGSFPEMTIIRDDKFQTEKNLHQTSTFRIEWSDNTNYSLTYVKGSNKRLDSLIGSKIYVEIIDILDDENYVYKATLLDKSIVIGILKKINS